MFNFSFDLLMTSETQPEEEQNIYSDYSQSEAVCSACDTTLTLLRYYGARTVPVNFGVENKSWL